MNKEKNTKRNIFLGLTITLFFVLIAMAAYAIGSVINAQYDEVNITASVGSRPVFTATPSNSIALDIPFINRTSDSEYEIANNSSSLNIALSTGYDTTAYCTYDIVWEWDETSTAANQYSKTSGATKEYTVSGTIGNRPFPEVQLNDYSVNNRKTVLDSYEISVNGSSSISYQTVNVSAHFYKTEAIQTAHQTANYSGKVIIENVVCNSESIKIVSETIADLVGTEGAKNYHLQHQPINPVKLSESEYPWSNENDTLLTDGFEFDSVNKVWNGSMHGNYYTLKIRQTGYYNFCINGTNSVSLTAGDLIIQNNGCVANYFEKDASVYLMVKGDEFYIEFSVNGVTTTTSTVIGDIVQDDYGVRYIGGNPNNFVWFNCSDLKHQDADHCERWRIIGVFNEKYDTNNDGIPDTEGNLTKIIRNDSLGDIAWDYKRNGVGSSTYNSSNDWSDSQLMMMLNPATFLNSGYVTENDASPVHSNTIDGEGYVLSDQQTPIRIYRNMGSYFDSSIIAYKPASTSTSGWSSTTQADASTFKRMSVASQAMIATTKWYLTGTASYDSSSNGLASHFYNYERNINDAGAVYNNTRPKIWYGKIGLMYPSDFGFATSGDSSVSGYDRASCLNKELYDWNSGYYATYCASNSWLYYAAASSWTKGTAKAQWTITPVSSLPTTVFFIISDGHVGSSDTYWAGGVRPVLYLESNVKFTSGDGTYGSPYKLAQ